MGPGNVATKCVGTDEYGNQYYEDFDVYCKTILYIRLHKKKMGRVFRSSQSYV